MKPHVPMAFLAPLLISTSCDRPPPVPPKVDPAPVESASAVLDRLDTRAPVPLMPMMANHQKQNMRDHLLVVQEVISALAADDFEAAERSANRMGFSEQMGQMCSHMGAGAPGFTEQALTFHRNADLISAAAKDRDRARVLTALVTTLQNCTACHAVWKQQVVAEADWQRLTGASAADGHHQQH